MPVSASGASNAAASSAALPTLEDLEQQLGGLSGKRVLVRCDWNVPLEQATDGPTITDPLRVNASLPTLKWLAERGAQVVACSHLGRPKGQPDPTLTLQPVVDLLASAGVPLTVLENLRFHAGEEANDQAFARSLVDGSFAAANTLAVLGDGASAVGGTSGGGGVASFDAYVNDAFGACHRAHASVVGPPAHLPSAAGRLLTDEVANVVGLRQSPRRPFVAVLGGAKVSDKLGVVRAVAELADQVLIGGAMCFTFLAAQGIDIGDSLYEPDQVGVCGELLDSGAPLLLPTDFAVLTAGGQFHQGISRLSAGMRGFDVGPATAIAFDDAIAEAGTVFWNGPMGMFEDERFAAGTQAVANSIAESRCYSVVGGGDSAAAVRQFGKAPYIDFISTGGGASLELLERGDLVGLAALRSAPGATADQVDIQMEAGSR